MSADGLEVDAEVHLSMARIERGDVAHDIGQQVVETHAVGAALLEALVQPHDDADATPRLAEHRRGLRRSAAAFQRQEADDRLKAVSDLMMRRPDRVGRGSARRV